MLPVFFIFALTASYSPEPFILNGTQYPALSETLEAGFTIGEPEKFHAYIVGSAQTWEDSVNLASFAPALVYYRFRAGLTNGIFDLSVSHLCIHPVFSSATIYQWGGDTAVSLTIHGKMRLF